MRPYAEFIAEKLHLGGDFGFEPIEIPDFLFDFQQALVEWAIRKGRAAIFADCGLGKTPVQLVWADNVARHTGGPVLILAPLAVSSQTVREGEKFGIPCLRSADGAFGDARIVVTNYERLERFDPSLFAGVVLDESSILKAFDGKTRNALVDAFAATPYRLCCTATPAPNDFMELGNHVEFLGVMRYIEMLATYFVHDSSKTNEWRLKGHATSDFWRWVSTWAMILRKPSDLGFADEKMVLPPLTIADDVIPASGPMPGKLFPEEAVSLLERRQARKASIGERVARCAEIVAGKADRQWLLWCNLNAESDALAKAIPGAVAVSGSDSSEHKEQSLIAFAAGDIRVLVSKPSIAGHGMNFQSCADMVFVGLSDSWEQWYQAIRRCWRFGQTRPVTVHVVTCETEGRVVENIKRKERDAETMYSSLLEHTRASMMDQLHKSNGKPASHETDVSSGDGWKLHLGDCVDVLADMADESIDYSIFSPPFASLYVYSDSPRDMGNTKSEDEFMRHFEFAVAQLVRVMKPGRLISFHCMNLPSVKYRDGFIGVRDFRGELIRVFQAAGMIYHSEVCIWKDPVTAMQRTKALGLLYKQLRKDSTMSRQGIADYLVTMRKPGENPAPVAHKPDDLPLSIWQKWASPIWDDIRATDVLNFAGARAERDERHICPLQLPVIQRGLVLWSNPDDLVLSPFAGIGSEGYMALKEGRRFVGIELKRSYYEQARKNLEAAKMEGVLPFSPAAEVGGGE